MQLNDLKKIKKETLMKGYSSLIVSVLVLAAIGASIFFFTNLRREPTTSNANNPADYVQSTLSTKETSTAAQAKERILEEAGIPKSGAGDISTNAEYNIQYIGPTEIVPWDEFWVEVTATTPDGVYAAKQAAEQWFLDKGFKEQDLCSGGTRVIFYLSEQSGKANAQSGKTFSRIPSFCN